MAECHRYPLVDYGKYERRKLMFKIFKSVDGKYERRKIMFKLFKSVDEKLEDI